MVDGGVEDNVMRRARIMEDIEISKYESIRNAPTRTPQGKATTLFGP